MENELQDILNSFAKRILELKEIIKDCENANLDEPKKIWNVVYQELIETIENAGYKVEVTNGKCLIFTPTILGRYEITTIKGE